MATNHCLGKVPLLPTLNAPAGQGLDWPSMQQTQADPLVDALVNDFGGNYVFALDILEQYRRDPQSVDASWRRVLRPAPRGPEAGTEARARSRRPDRGGHRRRPRRPTGSRPRPGTLVRQRAVRPRARQGEGAGRARHPARRHRPAHPRRRPAHRREHGGEPHRPHRDLDAQHPRAHAGGEPRASSTSTATRPRPARSASRTSWPGPSCARWTPSRASTTPTRSWRARPHRIQRDQVRLGIAVDVQKKDGSRTLLVPNIKDAGRHGLRRSS